MKRLIIYCFFILCLTQLANAQVTSSALAGQVLSMKSESLIGAAITATHEPTGTIFRAVTDENGHYQIENMIIGGPYSVKVTYVGYKDNAKNAVFLSLGKTGKVICPWKKPAPNWQL